MSSSKLVKIAVTELSPRLRKILWRFIYNRLAVKDTSGEFLFMNYGYVKETEKEGNFSLKLDPKDEPFRYTIQLYNHVVEEIDLRHKEILEVGCGRGGGGSFLLRYHQPCFYTGIDLSDSAIEWCKEHMQFSNGQWLQGSADALPLPNSSIDVVINIESSHCYPSMLDFINEVFRVLRPGGYFTFCDLRKPGVVKTLEHDFMSSGLKVLRRKIITGEVLRALEQVSEKREQQVLSHVPGFLQSIVRNFVGMKNTVLYNMMTKGELVYLSYLLQK